MTALTWAAATALAATFMVSPEDLAGFLVCPFHQVTGLPCPGCGLTRAFCCISRLQFLEAWHHNPFGYLFYAMALGLVARPLLGRSLVANLGARLAGSRATFLAPVALVIALYAYGIFRVVRTLQS